MKSKLFLIHFFSLALLLSPANWMHAAVERVESAEADNRREFLKRLVRNAHTKEGSQRFRDTLDREPSETINARDNDNNHILLHAIILWQDGKALQLLLNHPKFDPEILRQQGAFLLQRAACGGGIDDPGVLQCLLRRREITAEHCIKKEIFNVFSAFESAALLHWASKKYLFTFLTSRHAQACLQEYSGHSYEIKILQFPETAQLLLEEQRIAGLVGRLCEDFGLCINFACDLGFALGNSIASDLPASFDYGPLLMVELEKLLQEARQRRDKQALIRLSELPLVKIALAPMAKRMPIFQETSKTELRNR